MKKWTKEEIIRGIVAGILGLIEGILVAAVAALIFNGEGVELTLASQLIIVFIVAAVGTWIWDTWLLEEDVD